MASTAALMLLADSRFPTGAHAHSGGIEASHARGDVRSVADLEAFLDGRLQTSAAIEAAFAAAACKPEAPFAELDHQLAVRTPSPRLREVSRTLGRQLLRPAERAWPSRRYTTLRALHESGPMHAIALGAVAAAAGLEGRDAALCSLHQLIGSATTAAVKLMGLDPFDVNALAARLAARLDHLAAVADDLATTSTPADLPAGNSMLADILAEHHATWEVRLFAS